MTLQKAAPAPVSAKTSRFAYADNLKVLLVVGVIVAHSTMAWTENDAWVLEEPSVREPLLTLLNLVALVGVMFAMATFFLIAGTFTPGSLARKGLRRFLVDRTVRFGVPLVAYLLVLSPVVEYVDAVNNGSWDGGFWAFLPHVWRHPAPGPLWFLEVLWVFSAVYAVVRTVWPRRATGRASLPGRYLLVAGALVAVAAYLIRIGLPFAREVGQDLYLAQSPAWVAGFVLGVVGAERGWFERISPELSRRLFRVAWTSVAAVVVIVSVVVGALGDDVDVFFGGGTWQSAVLAVLQGALVVTMTVWLLDVFRRRANDQGRLLAVMGRAAFGAYLVHQAVLVGAVLATRWVGWPPELEFLAASALAVVGCFAVGALLARTPGISRIV